MIHRIIKITKGSKIHYEIQKKGVLWGWNTITYFDCCVDGSMAGEYPLEFKTIEDARGYIENEHETREICR